jgi:hypothetical protein
VKKREGATLTCRDSLNNCRSLLFLWTRKEKRKFTRKKEYYNNFSAKKKKKKDNNDICEQHPDLVATGLQEEEKLLDKVLLSLFNEK